MAFSRFRVSAWMILFLLAPAVGLSMLQLPGNGEHGAIDYLHAKANDPVTRLQAKIDAVEVHLEFDSHWGYMPSMLQELQIPPSSQSLVFSKTSLQISHISPQTPRALYFNDDVYVGWVQGGPVIEVASVDPKTPSRISRLWRRSSFGTELVRTIRLQLLLHKVAFQITVFDRTEIQLQQLRFNTFAVSNGHYDCHLWQEIPF